MAHKGKKGRKLTGKTKPTKHPFARSDFEAVLKAATKPVEKEQAEKQSEGT